MEQYTSANVEMAVLQFYYQGASQETHQWLTNAQMSTSAWNFAWELLMPDKKPEVQFFGASTIAIKVSKFWHEVPADQVNYQLSRKVFFLKFFPFTVRCSEEANYRNADWI